MAKSHQTIILQRKISKKRWRNYRLINFEPIPVSKKECEDYHQLAMDAQFKYTGEEPVICLHFGCGKTLSPTERACSNYCINHQKEPHFTSLIDPYLSQ